MRSKLDFLPPVIFRKSLAVNGKLKSDGTMLLSMLSLSPTASGQNLTHRLVANKPDRLWRIITPGFVPTLIPTVLNTQRITKIIDQLVINASFQAVSRCRRLEWFLNKSLFENWRRLCPEVRLKINFVNLKVSWNNSLCHVWIADVRIQISAKIYWLTQYLTCNKV